MRFSLYDIDMVTIYSRKQARLEVEMENKIVTGCTDCAFGCVSTGPLSILSIMNCEKRTLKSQWAQGPKYSGIRIRTWRVWRIMVSYNRSYFEHRISIVWIR